MCKGPCQDRYAKITSNIQSYSLMLAHDWQLLRLVHPRPLDERKRWGMGLVDLGAARVPAAFPQKCYPFGSQLGPELMDSNHPKSWSLETKSARSVVEHFKNSRGFIGLSRSETCFVRKNIIIKTNMRFASQLGCHMVNVPKKNFMLTTSWINSSMKCGHEVTDLNRHLPAHNRAGTAPWHTAAKVKKMAIKTCRKPPLLGWLGCPDRPVPWRFTVSSQKKCRDYHRMPT